jgi:siroheme decarboxylase
MDDVDKKMLDALQSEFPLEARPFAAIAERLGIGEREAMERTDRLRRDGFIRRIGASLNPRKLGYDSTLAGAKIPNEKLDESVEYINSFPQITHNYEREGEFNVWFTIIAKDRAAIESILCDIRKNTGVEELLDLPATHTFKIKVNFRMGEEV